MAEALMPNEFGEVLKGALALTPDDQARLCSVLQRVTGVPDARSTPDAEVKLPPAPHLTLEVWLQRIQNESAWSQLMLLDKALEAEDAPDQRAMLEEARAQLLRGHPPLAIRRAVTDLASRSPGGLCVGILGLMVGVVGIGRLLLRVLF